MAYSEKLLHKIALEKCEVHYTKRQYSLCTTIASVNKSILTKLIGNPLSMHNLIIYTKNASNLTMGTEIWFQMDDTKIYR